MYMDYTQKKKRRDETQRQVFRVPLQPRKRKGNLLEKKKRRLSIGKKCLSTKTTVFLFKKKKSLTFKNQ